MLRKANPVLRHLKKPSLMARVLHFVGKPHTFGCVFSVPLARHIDPAFQLRNSKITPAPAVRSAVMDV
jgi:hypothetical protein